ncbi:11-beta-hydroxysteroid dehydrogenase 1B-like [Chenopodium quinoa]|uniref:11-beta-hydroxysteroid dehydrogenase 1B-like n=1 Tax=Chenopodium quinoa TaxID=63459 RepID=UPI000B76C2D0|nr:11-beta-hydroxysteroid dehydrogenase 1B-like [Chenopodium quinoa]
MELINTFLNFAAPPFTFITLCFLLPPFQILKFFLSVFSTVFPEDVSGKVVLITGASSGIGEHLAYEYAERGACLVLTARRQGSLDEVADLCLQLGSPEAIVVPGDITKVEDCRRIIEATIGHYGRLDHLVNNAGIIGVSQFDDLEDVTRMRPVMDINFWGSVYMTRFAIPYLKQTAGKIVAMSSSASWMPVPRESFYNASKAAMSAFFETLRVELGSEVKITIVTPGIIESKFSKGKVWTESGMKVDQDLRDVQVNVIPVGTVEGTAKSIVRSVCRGDRYVTVPAWFKVTYFLEMLCPEVLEWAYRLMFLISTDSTPTGAMGIHAVDFPGAKAMLYPSGIQSADIKRK